MTRTILRIAFVIALIVTTLTLRVVIAGELEIAESTRALLEGDPRGATTHAREAALWYAPGAPHVRVAYDRLMALGASAEAHNEDQLALNAYNAVATASESTRWFVKPYAIQAGAAREAIARINARLPQPPATALDTPTTIERAELEALQRTYGPRTDWVIALGCAFAVWLGGLVFVLFRGIDGSGRLIKGRAIVGLGIAFIGAAGWMIALYFA